MLQCSDVTPILVQEAPFSDSDIASFLENRRMWIEKNIRKPQFSDLGNRPYGSDPDYNTGGMSYFTSYAESRWVSVLWYCCPSGAGSVR